MAIVRTYDAFDSYGYKDWQRVPRVVIGLNSGYDELEVHFTVDEAKKIVKQLQESILAATATHTPEEEDVEVKVYDGTEALVERYFKIMNEARAEQDAKNSGNLEEPS